MPPLFGLAPDGVCRAAAVTSSAVRSYRTISTLPWRTKAVCFLWHFPSARAGRTLSGIVPRWSPDFPPAPFTRNRRSPDPLAFPLGSNKYVPCHPGIFG